ncbi:MAG: HEPN domain-containing protein [Candidatus Thiodiazotropha sp. (ex Epidulcina cf. delphinae)]|nr:HEPN domain-containing protein [Candidatus Thiodiazotropha sp. (ex Epidulcina cf. delphinae)]
MMKYSYKDTRGPTAWYRMKTRPKHLPPRKQYELKKIVEAVRARHDVEMIILFGSHARGDWVEDKYEEDHITYEYRSDFDILIVTADKGDERDIAYDNDLKAALQPGRHGTRINYIVHTIQHVNQMLAERRFFFMDILKEGYMLHDAKRYKLVRPPKELPPEVMLRHAQEYFQEWMESADDFFETAQETIEKGKSKLAAFLLHQSTERYITCLLLVHTGYRPKEHDMEKLIQQAAGFEHRFAAIFPNDGKQEKHLFDLLRRAYVDARYSKSYRITVDELNTLTERLQHLRDIVEMVCQEKIAELASRSAT